MGRVGTEQTVPTTDAEKWVQDARLKAESQFRPFDPDIGADALATGNELLNIHHMRTQGASVSACTPGNEAAPLNAREDAREDKSPATAIFNYCMLDDPARCPSELLALVSPGTPQTESRDPQSCTVPPFGVHSSPIDAGNPSRGHESSQVAENVTDIQPCENGLSPLSCHLIEDLVQATTRTANVTTGAAGVFDAMDSLISEASSSPFSFAVPVPEKCQSTPGNGRGGALHGNQASVLDKKIFSQSLGDPYSVVSSRKISCGPYSRTAKNIVGLDELQDGSSNGASLLHQPSNNIPGVTEGAIFKGHPRFGKTPKMKQPGNAGGGTKRKPRTYSRATPSQHCHVCSRRPTEASPHAACGNLAHGMCRKTICEKCFLKYGWNLADAREASKTGWLCPHCQGICPDRAQCHIYDRTSERRRNKTVNHRKSKQKARQGDLAKTILGGETESTANAITAEDADIAPGGNRTGHAQKRKQATKKHAKRNAQIETPSISLEGLNCPGQGDTNVALGGSPRPGISSDAANPLEHGVPQGTVHPGSFRTPEQQEIVLDLLFQTKKPLSGAKGRKGVAQLSTAKVKGRPASSGGKNAGRKAGKGRNSTGRPLKLTDKAPDCILETVTQHIMHIPEIPTQGLDTACADNVAEDFASYSSYQAAQGIFPMGLDDVMDVFGDGGTASVENVNETIEHGSVL